MCNFPPFRIPNTLCACAYVVRAPLFSRVFRIEKKNTEELATIMPESRSRSRKRKAPATAAAGKGASSDVEKDTQSQSSVLSTGKEERYVPRFGPSSAGKRARTAGHGAVFSCSQPVAQPQPSSGTRVRRASGNATEEDIDNSIHTADGTAPDKVYKYIAN